MSSTNTTPKYFTPTQFPPLLGRATVTPSQRPSTSGGETVEPKSDFLREALREKKGLPRSQSTTPRKVKTGPRTQISQMAHDELFLPSSDDEAKFSSRRGSARAQRTRRASDANVFKASPSTQVRNLGLREADAQMDKLLKDNWDLKHRITLHDQAFSKLRIELDDAIEELERCRELRERNRELEEAIDMISKQAAAFEEESKTLKVTNEELTNLNDDLGRELESKDEGIEQRQLAIEEAAGIIQKLELANERLKKEQQDSPRTDSDYFSGEAESVGSTKGSLRPTTAATCGSTEFGNPPDSDYFSADNSPNGTPTTPKRAQLVEHQDKALQMERAKAIGAAYNREIGLRSQASQSSLLSSFLETPIPEQSKLVQRALRRKAPAIPTSPPRGPFREELLRAKTPAWSDARELRTVYEQGALNNRLGSFASIRHSGQTPSVTVASPSASNEDIFSLSGSLHSVGTLSSLATTVSDSAVSSAVTARRPEPKRPQNVTPVNYSSWPAQLPEWPPSLGLRQRGLLFDGADMEEMFPDSPPRPTSSRESFSNVHLMRTSAAAPGVGRERHTRSSSAAPTANAFAPPPSLLSRTTSMKGSALSFLRRPLGPERSRTLPPFQ